MKRRILEKSPVVGYQLYRQVGKRPDGTTVVYPNYYIRHAGKDTCTETDKLTEAKTKIKKMASEDLQERKQLIAPVDEIRVGVLLDLVIEDYRKSGQKTLADIKGKIKHLLA